jgi:hypothetical protein
MAQQDQTMGLMLIYRMFTKLLSWMVLCTHIDPSKDVEILLLRHQLAVLQRRTPGRSSSRSCSGFVGR